MLFARGPEIQAAETKAPGEYDTILLLFSPILVRLPARYIDITRHYLPRIEHVSCSVVLGASFSRQPQATQSHIHDRAMDTTWPCLDTMAPLLHEQLMSSATSQMRPDMLTC